MWMKGGGAGALQSRDMQLQPSLKNMKTIWIKEVEQRENIIETHL